MWWRHHDNRLTAALSASPSMVSRLSQATTWWRSIWKTVIPLSLNSKYYLLVLSLSLSPYSSLFLVRYFTVLPWSDSSCQLSYNCSTSNSSNSSEWTPCAMGSRCDGPSGQCVKCEGSRYGPQCSWGCPILSQLNESAEFGNDNPMQLPVPNDVVLFLNAASLSSSHSLPFVLRSAHGN